ncbi:MAG: multiubiquitin domain-containing protein [Pirellulaceae bacterium]|nr:multiubiquitin domain-containing protein [Pirellulaceae bacterium]
MVTQPEDEFEAEEVDVEELVKQGKPVPKAKLYRIRIDKERYEVNAPFITKDQLLALVSKTADKWRIHQKLSGGQMDEVTDGEKVDLREKGVERFVTMELAQTDGEMAAHEAPPARRAFDLPEEDAAFLNSLGLNWETVKEERVRWLLIHGYPIPHGFNVNRATMAIKVEGGYPPAKLDMAYFLPHLSKQSGTGIPNLTPLKIDGEEYQQWSRHYEWREGVDDLAVHYRRVEQWLLDELKR